VHVKIEKSATTKNKIAARLEKLFYKNVMYFFKLLKQECKYLLDHQTNK
jgi:hypothetical protein